MYRRRVNAFVVRLRAASPAMWVALVGSVLSLVLTVYARRTWHDPADGNERSWEHYARLMMADAGVTFVIRAMLVAGILAAAAMATRRARMLLMLAATALALLALERVGVWHVLPLLLDDSERTYRAMNHVDMVAGALAFVGVMLVVVAAAPSPVMPAFAVPAVLGAAVLLNLPIAGEAIGRALHDHEWIGVSVFWIAELCLIAGLAGLTGAIMHGQHAVPEPRVAVLGLKRTERGLLIKAVMPLVLFLAAIAGVGSAGTLKFVVLGGLAAMVFAWTVIGAGAITLVRSRLEGLSASRLLVGAGLVMWWAIVYFNQAMNLYSSLFRASGGSHAERLAQSWTVVGPIVAAAGIALIGWSIAAFAKARGNEELATSAVARTVVVIAIDLTVVLVTNYLVMKQPGPGGIFAVVGVIGSIIGTLAFAKLFDRTASMVETMPALPTAALVSKGDS